MMTGQELYRRVVVDEVAFDEPLERRLRCAPEDGAVALHWLGQAGFVISAGERRLVIDPYLSDSLTEKYRDTATPHERMMPAPTTVEGLGRVDLVLITHRHSDHMDPGSLRPLAGCQPWARFVVPASSQVEAQRLSGVAAHRLTPLDAGDAFEPWPGLVVRAVRAAHETLEQDEAGRYKFLGYVLRFATPGGPVTLFHSGDTVPFAGQADEVALFHPDVALLPVNGRSAELLARGSPGNMTLDEALLLAEAAGAGTMVAHHHGMFNFNTCDPMTLEARQTQERGPVRLLVARIGTEVCVRAQNDTRSLS